MAAAIKSPGSRERPLAEAFAFGRPAGMLALLTASVDLTDEQRDIMCCLAGCSDVKSELGRVKPQVGPVADRWI